MSTTVQTMSAIRYLNKNNNANERENYSKWWLEQINHYGVSVDYYTSGYSLSSQDYLYGEDPTSRFSVHGNVIMITDITNDALMLSKFGVMADCDMTAVVHISAFYATFGPGAEPKAGDLIRMSEYGALRPGLRSPPIYEITERDDEYLPLTNPLIGHYVWYIKCKRYEYSYEPGVPNGPANTQFNDSGEYGRLEGGANPAETTTPYDQSVQKDAHEIFQNPLTEDNLLELIQTKYPNEYVPLPAEEKTPVDVVPVIPDNNVKPLHRRPNSAYDYYDSIS